MNKKIRTKAKFENGLFKPSEPVNLPSGEEVELIVIREEKVLDISGDINDNELMDLASKNPSFNFLANKEENIYSVKDLKKRYKK